MILCENHRAGIAHRALHFVGQTFKSVDVLGQARMPSNHLRRKRSAATAASGRIWIRKRET